MLTYTKDGVSVEVHQSETLRIAKLELAGWVRS